MTAKNIINQIAKKRWIEYNQIIIIRQKEETYDESCKISQILRILLKSTI